MRLVQRHRDDLLLLIAIVVLVLSIVWFASSTLPDALSRQDYVTQQAVLTVIAPLRTTLTAVAKPTATPTPSPTDF